MEGKYGRIFTEADVNLLITKSQEMGMSPHDAIIFYADQLTFPKDEPVFVLRAKDELAAGAVRNYLLVAEARASAKRKVTQKFLDQVTSAMRAFEDFRKNNPDRMKTPD